MSIDQALKHLFNQAAKHPLAVKGIFFSENGKVDCKSIRSTIDYNNSRIPSEGITLAREVLMRCHSEIDEQMVSLFFMYHYGYLGEYQSQLIDGIALLTKQDTNLIEIVLKGYRQDLATPLAEIAKQFNLSYDTADNYCRKIRKCIAGLHAGVWECVEPILIKSEMMS